MIPRLRPTLGLAEYLAAWSPTQPADIKHFEQCFAKLMRQKHAIAFPHGRTGLYCLLQALALQNKDIIMPAWTCVVVPHATVHSGNEPLFIDSSAHDYNMDLELVEKEITENTGAIIPTSIFGHPVNLDRLDSIKKNYPHIPIIQDCAHSFSCSWQGRPVHKEGIAAIFGLNVSKLMTSIFGGMITTDDDDLAEKLKLIRQRIIKPAPWLKNWQRRIYFVAATLSLTPPIYGVINKLEQMGALNRFVKYYDDSIIDMPKDWDISMCEAEAKVGIKQCSRYDSIVSIRQYNAKLYHKLLQDTPHITLPPHNDGATYSHFTILVKNRKKFLKDMLQQDIQLGWLIEYCIPEMQAYKGRKGYRYCPVAQTLSKQAVNLPLWCDNTIVQSIVNKIKTL